VEYQRLLTAEGIGEIVSQIESSDPHVYWPAEDYHQKYLVKNPNGYDCHSSTGVLFAQK
jgi:peptide-methionine (S)-S-oxide reductase